MNKNWLIRTKSNHILGPVSKDKVIELYKNGSIKGDDEVCSGNGFWFFIREKDLIEKYLLSSHQQPFNPISEAKDVLTYDKSEPAPEPVVEDDVTLVGKALNLKDLQEDAPPPPILPAEQKSGPSPEIVHQHVPVHDVSQNKKKIASNKVHKKNIPNKTMIKKDHTFIRYLGIFTFILFLLLIYFRKTIMGHLSYLSPINSAYAQSTTDEGQKKKLFLDQLIEIDGVTFRPDLGLHGLRIISMLRTETLDCGRFNDVVTQLGVILYPEDQHNENFLKRVRDCVIPLPDSNPVKRWLKRLGKKKSIQPTTEQIEQLGFLDSLLNSGFNLITAPEQKNKIVTMINFLDGDYLPERILQSYLYLLIGNISHSDSLLVQTYKTSPFTYWTQYPYQKTFWSEAVSLRIDKILERLSKHPTDRTNLHLFVKYMYDFFNDNSLREATENFYDEDSISEKMKLKVYQAKGGDFSTYVNYKLAGVKKRRDGVKSDVLNRAPKDFPWYWYFFDEFHQLPKSEKVLVLNPYFNDKSDTAQIFFHFYATGDDSLMESFYQGKGISEIKQKRHFFIKLFNQSATWPFALYYLIEMGSIGQETVEKIMNDAEGL